MSPGPVTEQTTPQAVVGTRSAAAQPVVLVDRIAWQWYLATAAIPLIGTLIGFIAGIVFMARSKIGPALALWATAYLAAAVWGAIGWAIVIDNAFNGDGDSANVSALTQSAASDEQPPTGSDNAQTEPLPESQGSTPADGSSGATKACGNLRAAVGPQPVRSRKTSSGSTGTLRTEHLARSRRSRPSAPLSVDAYPCRARARIRWSARTTPGRRCGCRRRRSARTRRKPPTPTRCITPWVAASDAARGPSLQDFA